MKRKGIPFWEQHLERLVLGAAVLFFLGFTAWQVVKVPNQEEIVGQGTVTPGEIDDLLDAKAQAIGERLAPEARAELEIPDHEPVLDLFEERLAASVSRAELIRPTNIGAKIGDGTHTALSDVLYVVPSIPAPELATFDQSFDAITSGVVEQYPDLQAHVPDVAPYDLTWATAAAVFDTQAVIDAYATKRGAMESIPTTWYSSRVDILDVRVEREEMEPGGAWTGRRILDPIPGQFSFRTELVRDDLKARDVDSIMEQLAAGNQPRIVQPDFYETLNGSYSPPDPLAPAETEEMTDEERQIARLVRKLRRAHEERDRKAQELQELGGDEIAPPPPPAGRERPGGTGTPGGGDRRTPPPGARRPPGGEGGFGGGMGEGTRESDEDRERKKRKLENLRDRIAKLDRDIVRDEGRLQELAGDAGLDEADGAGDARVLLLAHDLTIEPGKRYRYRFIVDVYNPFYGRKLDLVDDQRDLAESIVLTSAPSEWSADKLAIPFTRVYVTRATRPGGGLQGQDLGSATAEVYRFRQGRWWKESFKVEPGDQVGRTETVGRGENATEVDFSTDWFVLDIQEDLTATSDDGYAADVVLQSLVDNRMVVQSPRDADDNLERQRLQDRVEAAEAAGDLASAG